MKLFKLVSLYVVIFSLFFLSGNHFTYAQYADGTYVDGTYVDGTYTGDGSYPTGYIRIFIFDKSRFGSFYTGSALVTLNPGGVAQSTFFGSTTFNTGPTGTYSVTLTLPSGYLLDSVTKWTPGMTVVTPPDVTVSGLVPGNNVFYYINTGGATGPTPVPVSTITGRVYNDTNSNGVQDLGEAGYSNATVAVTGQGTQVTDTTGSYIFSGVPNGTYSVTLTVPSGYIVTNPPNPKLRTVPPSAVANFGIHIASCVVGGTTLSGTVYIDNSGANNCTQSSAYSNGATVTIRDTSGNQTATGNTNTTPPVGAYSLNDLTACGQKTASLSNLTGGYAVKKVSFDGGPCTDPTSINSYSFDFSAAHTLDWFVSTTSPWFQIDTGDIRSGSLVDNLPSNIFPPTTNGNPLTNPVFFSSGSAANFGTGSNPIWLVNNEFAQVAGEPLYNDDPTTKNGFFSYSFFINRTRIKGLSTTNVPGCPVTGDCTITAGTNLSSSASNTPYLVNGNLTITGYTHTAGAHVLLLVNGTANIQSNIKVPAGVGNLFVLAAKDDVNIAPSVGAASPAIPCGTSACSNIEGIYTAEDDIILQSQGNTCADGVTADKQFTLAGTFVTNSIKPFKIGGTGVFSNLRSLCAQDNNYPVFVIQSRYDFVPQLTDFYKIPSVRWKEVNP